jgi:hypothetical protein
MRSLAVLLLVLSSGCVTAYLTPPGGLLRVTAELPALQCGRTGKRPLEVRVERLAGGRLAIAFVYPALGQQFKYLVEEVRSLPDGRRALAGHKLRHNDGNSAWVEPASTFQLFASTTARADELNTTYQISDHAPQVHVDLVSGALNDSRGTATDTFLRCENLTEFLAALGRQ